MDQSVTSWGSLLHRDHFCGRTWLNKEDIKSAIIKDNKWKCHYCIPSEKDCNVCKLKDKEINDFKKCIVDIEKNYASLCNEIKLCSERSTDLEDRLAKEKNEGGDSLIKVGTDVGAQAFGILGVNFCLGIRIWEVNFAQTLGFWQFLTKNV